MLLANRIIQASASGLIKRYEMLVAVTFFFFFPFPFVIIHFIIASLDRWFGHLTVY